MLDEALSRVRTELLQAGSEPEFWNRTAAVGTPLVDELPDGRIRVTFLYRHRGDDTPFRVYVDASSLTDHHAAQLTTMTRLDDTGIWVWACAVSRTWRGSYRFMPVSEKIVDALDPPGIGDTRDGVRSRFLGLLEYAVPDPVVRKSAPGGTFPHHWDTQSLAEMPDAPVQRWWNDPNLGDTRPRLLRWNSAALGIDRDIWLHETGSAADTFDRPLIIVLDGLRWIDQAPLAPVLDKATAEGELPPAVVLFVDSLDAQTRGAELPCNRQFWEAVVDELIPLAAKETAFTSDPRRTVVAGQSYGGLAALFAGLEFPDRFGLVASQSGSFWWPVMSHGDVRGPDGGHVADMLGDLGSTPDITVHMTVGIHEGDMPIHNRHIRDLLHQKGIDVSYAEFDGGHEWVCWRSELVESLLSLLG